ncbi:MAG: hypothetical protein IPJ34_25785 [Myxococcales bacterium]|nr:hypothetical protein [Myxococcales bacterium]
MIAIVGFSEGFASQHHPWTKFTLISKGNRAGAAPFNRVTRAFPSSSSAVIQDHDR